MQSLLRAEYLGNGPLQCLIDDPSITEILVNGWDCIWFECAGRLQVAPLCFLSEFTYRNFLQRLCQQSGQNPTLNFPFANASWNGFRVHTALSPIASHTCLCLRRHPPSPWTFKKLEAVGWCSQAEAAILQSLVADRANFLIVGPTGSGKTSVLNSCLQEVQVDERVLLLEDTSELTLPNSISTKLLTRHDPQTVLRDVELAELVKQSLRMRPDRIVLGEIRGGEARDLLMAFATGHRGCMGTLHADSARQALIRLEMLVQVGAAQWCLKAVRQLIFLSLQAIVVVGKSKTGERRLEGIYRLASLEELGFLLESVRTDSSIQPAPKPGSQ